MKAAGKEIGNANITGRMKQLIVLIVAILIGMIISVATADAKDFQRDNQKRQKAQYKKQTVAMAHACTMLKKKHNVTTNSFVKGGSKLKFR